MYGVLRVEFTVSAIVWIPFTFLQFYLFREHLTRSRNLQSNILLFFAVGSVFRCAWFWVDRTVYYVISEIINRIALLLQFSGISLLMLMWSRAIAISKMTDMAYNESAEANAMENGRDTVMVDTRKLRLQRYREATQAVMAQLTGMNTFQHYIVFTAVVNVAVWGFVLCSLADTSYLWYNINIISISMACLIAALGTLFVGLWVSVALHSALTPVYVSNNGSTTYNTDQRLRCVCMGKYGARCEYVMGMCGLCSLYAFIFNYNQSDTRQGLQMQREVLKVILSVSTITSFFFVVRSLCFMYRPLVLEEGNGYWHTSDIGDLTYPFFFYQVPELVPNLVIALGISPPNGILRQAFSRSMYAYRVLANTVCCGLGGSAARLQNAQQSVYGSEFASMSPTARPSFLADGTGVVGPDPTRPQASAQFSPTPVGSAPIAIPINSNRRLGSSANLHESASERQAGSKTERSPSPAPAIDRGGPSADADAETRSPVHADTQLPTEHTDASASASETDSRPQKNSSIYSRDTGSSAMQSLQLETEDGSGGGGGRAGTRQHSTSSSKFLSFVGSITSAASSLAGNASGRSGRRSSTRRDRGASEGSAMSMGAARDAEDEDEAQWDRQRRDSAEIAEMLYRINSFSTSEMSSGMHTLASSLTGSTAQNSVDSNTINNSRRHYITEIVGGNRSLTPSSAPGRSGTPTDSSAASANKSRFSGWFS